MSELIHQFIDQQADKAPARDALLFKDEVFSYEQLRHEVRAVATGLLGLGLQAGERVAIYLPKLPQTVFSLFGTSAAGGVFVPINPLLKPAQVVYILKDCNVRVLITSAQRLKQLQTILGDCHDLRTVVAAEDSAPDPEAAHALEILNWKSFCGNSHEWSEPARIDADMTAILYTSGSTGNPKGVVLSHCNMVTGAKSVASYLRNTASDRLLAVLPFSFDYGLSQMTTAFSVGASVVLMDYLLPRDVLKAIARYKVTGLAAVPPLWNQLAGLEWPPEAVSGLRYITNSGGAMPRTTTESLTTALPNTLVYLMYGLTEAFRSTYLPPDQVCKRPESMGKAIPNAEVMVVREDGSECAPGEPGELVHRGSLVAMGYWNDREKTAERFKPCPGQLSEIPLSEVAVWSGDQVRRDEEGYLYFISRKDEMIKTSGYRVSPTEVEEVLYASGLLREVAALGLPHPALGQAIFVVAAPSDHADSDAVLKYCQRELPNYMVPQGLAFMDALPRNQNGKIDRKTLASQYKDEFQA
jgi:acyl-CoA ligase (AMP-forming) (exosortase A-associated)